MHVNDPHHLTPEQEADISGLGLKLFLAGLSFLFAATMIGYVVVMMGGSGTQWRPGASPTFEEALRGAPPGSVPIPGEGQAVGGARSVDDFEAGLLSAQPMAQAQEVRLSVGVWMGLGVATVVMLLSSVAMAGTLRAVRQGDRRRFLRFLYGAAFLGLAFLILQTANWMQLALELPLAEGGLRSATFYLLTGTHALHVVGGLVPLGLLVSRARAGRYGPRDWVGVRNVTWYWHFLDAVWVLMLATMLVVGH